MLRYNKKLTYIILIIFFTSIFIPGCKLLNSEMDLNQISNEKVYKIIKKNKDYVILDVRTEKEYVDGHLRSAVLIPVGELEDRLDEIPGDKPIIVYCKSGIRSLKASEILLENNFAPVYNMEGGIESWKREGYPFLIGDDLEAKKSEETVDNAEMQYNIISIDEVFGLIVDNNEEYQIIDVRSREEYDRVHIRDAISAPILDIPDCLKGVSKEKLKL